MWVNQISVFLENKSGRLAAVTGILAEAGINIRALSIADTSDFGILRLIVNEPSRAYQVLKEAGFTVSTTEVIAVAIEDRPGGLAEVLKLLDRNQINVEYLYAFVSNSSGKALVLLKVENVDKAVEVLKANGVKIPDPNVVYNI
ncbi:ACT domain-containing protein [Desulforudis sp. 1088]|uniref:ACT domain-containing protein n=1 Tax=unclassified Candidatus Desulforudis TaxID=2635950 RepID=UPI00349591BA